MSRQRDVDWSDWKGHVDAPVSPLSKPIGNVKKGLDVVKEALSTGNLPDLNGPTPKQPTNEEMFGHLVVSEEELAKKEAEWANGHQEKMKELSKKIDHLNKSGVEGSWGLGKSFNSLLSKEELAARNGYVGEE